MAIQSVALPFGNPIWAFAGNTLWKNERLPLDNVLKALSTPFQPFELQIPSPVRSQSPPLSQADLRKAHAELRKGTTTMGRPQRVWPARHTHGIIGEHRNRQRLRLSPTYTNITPDLTTGATTTVSSTPETLYETPPTVFKADIKIVAPIPIVAIPRTLFEVKAYKSPLPADLVAGDGFDGPVFSRLVEDDDDDFGVDENKAPASILVDNTDRLDLDVLEPSLRAKRQPFSVLHFDKANPVDQRPPPKSYDAFPVPDQVKSNKGLKGMARLRALAPSPIDMASVYDSDHAVEKMKAAVESIINSEQETVPGAPVMSTIPLPASATSYFSPRRSLFGPINNTAMLPRLPPNPYPAFYPLSLLPLNQSRLLDILNGY